MGLFNGTQEKRFAGAAEAGTQEAYSAIVQHQFGDASKAVQERIRDILEEQKAIQKDQVEVGQQILDYLEKNPVELRGI